MEHDFLRRTEDLYERSCRRNVVTATGFCDPSESMQALKFLRSQKISDYILYGGYADAERTRLLFLPDYMDKDYFPFDEYINVLYVKCPFGKPSHRDYLGSLTGLGIKRESLGDILVFKDGAYIICTPQVSGFIRENLTKVSRFGVKCEVCGLEDIKVPEPVFDAVSGTVASPRADSVVATAFGISRSRAAELIRDGRLAVNHVEEVNVSAEICEGSLLSLRGFGRAKLFEVGGMSKKGRQFITLHVFSKGK
ncbi:MAG: RNA-binding protein [Oscillospiraceae bacterium]|nr:RNA-binding protein [Oscillospiraceae bacterium]